MKTVLEFKQMKMKGEKIAMVTVYDYTMARIFSETAIDCLLVGDSLAMVIHGFDSTVNATNQFMINHTSAVSRGAPHKFIIADMPFLSCRKGRKTAMKTVDALIKAGASAVKIEGVRGNQEIISHIVESGVPVMGHLGLMPQFVHSLGGHRVQGNDEAKAKVVFEQALEIEHLGCFAVVLECLPHELTTQISRKLTIPTIGIGAGSGVDGQVLVAHDMFGLTDMRPKFLKHYLNGKEMFSKALNNYCDEVKSGAYPLAEHSYN